MKKILLFCAFLTIARPAYSQPFSLEQCRQAVARFFTLGRTKNNNSVLSQWEPLKWKDRISTTDNIATTEPAKPLSESVLEPQTPSVFRVLLVRHAPYSESYNDSSISSKDLRKIEREQKFLGPALSQKGVSKFKDTLAKLPLLNFDLMIYSPYVRTWQTAGLLSRHYRVEEIVSREKEEHYTAESVLEEIKASSVRQIILVDHQPFLQDFLDRVEGLTFVERSYAKRRVVPGSMIVLEFPDSFRGPAKLISFLHHSL